MALFILGSVSGRAIYQGSTSRNGLPRASGTKLVKDTLFASFLSV